ncbi:MAG: mechanosensitive ion channel family protein [Algisphaera sp.]
MLSLAQTADVVTATHQTAPHGWDIAPATYWVAITIALLATAGLLTYLIRLLSGSLAERPLRLLRGLGLALAAFMLAMLGLGFQTHDLGFKLAATGAWIVGVYAGLTLVRAWFVKAREAKMGHGAPRLLIDLVTFGMTIVGVSLVLSAVWGQRLDTLITGLGLGSIVIGLALQDTLGNLFAGVALMTERPYSIGDWIRIDDLEGRVVEVNWRAVHIMTRNQDLVILPNAMVATAKIINEVRPSTLKAIPVQLGFSYDDPPNKVKYVLRRAALATEGVRSNPEPTIRVTGYDDFSIGYEVRLFLDNHDQRPDILDRFNGRVWYAAKRSGLTIPFPIRTVYHQQLDPPSTPPADNLLSYLRKVEVFEPLDDADLQSLIDSSRRLDFGHGEHIVREGEAGDALYVLTTGHAAVVVGEQPNNVGIGSGGNTVGKLGPGDFFGEMAALTGEPRSASVVATIDLEALAIGPSALKQVLEARPELAEAMADIIERRREALESTRQSTANAAQKTSSQKSARRQIAGCIRGFLGL